MLQVLRLLGLLLEGRALEEVDAQLGRHRRQRIALEREGGRLRQRLEVHGGTTAGSRCGRRCGR
eukprot:scaffold123797_cov51-Phaeocystis_antarctica.AAC.1